QGNGAGNINTLPTLQGNGAGNINTLPTLQGNGAGNINTLPTRQENGGQPKHVSHQKFCAQNFWREPTLHD
ncbi:MAG: hypothetical protein DRR00_04165, partial [Candidatus Parabeggiatoa sp. nov. 3]